MVLKFRHPVPHDDGQWPKPITHKDRQGNGNYSGRNPNPEWFLYERCCNRNKNYQCEDSCRQYTQTKTDSGKELAAACGEIIKRIRAIANMAPTKIEIAKRWSLIVGLNGGFNVLIQYAHSPRVNSEAVFKDLIVSSHDGFLSHPCGGI
jgi:hypothetical protein